PRARPAHRAWPRWLLAAPRGRAAAAGRGRGCRPAAWRAGAAMAIRRATGRDDGRWPRGEVVERRAADQPAGRKGAGRGPQPVSHWGRSSPLLLPGEGRGGEHHLGADLHSNLPHKAKRHTVARISEAHPGSKVRKGWILSI